tara:strand:- start:1102 stop:2184 length:1083 start_codon:yes stop_codon:yes gene_type:complete
MAAPYALLPLIAYIILLLKDKNVDKTFYFYFLNFILYITSKFLILYFTSDETIAASSSLKYLYPESFISAWYHALRTFPMTWLFVDGKFEMFQLYIKENYFYVSLIFILSLITSFFVIRNIDGDRENLDIKNIKVLSFIGVYQFLFPIVLIALNKRYNIQITNHGLGHAHYLVLSQCLGLLFVLLVLTAKFRIFILKYTIVFSVLISFLTTVSFQLSDFTSKRLEPKRHLYPYIFFENIKDFAEKYEIEKFVILNNNNSGFWQDNRIMSSIFKKKVKVYGNWMFNENKINNLEIGKHSNTLLMYDLKLNNILHSSKFCLLTDILNNSENNFEYRCSNKFYYESKKMLKYFESDSFIKKVN